MTAEEYDSARRASLLRNALAVDPDDPATPEWAVHAAYSFFSPNNLVKTPPEEERTRLRRYRAFARSGDPLDLFDDQHREWEAEKAKGRDAALAYVNAHRRAGTMSLDERAQFETLHPGEAQRILVEEWTPEAFAAEQRGEPQPTAQQLADADRRKWEDERIAEFDQQMFERDREALLAALVPAMTDETRALFENLRDNGYRFQDGDIPALARLPKEQRELYETLAQAYRPMTGGEGETWLGRRRQFVAGAWQNLWHMAWETGYESFATELRSDATWAIHGSEAYENYRDVRRIRRELLAPKLADLGPLANPAMDAAGIVGYMAPSLAMGFAGKVAQGARAATALRAAAEGSAAAKAATAAKTAAGVAGKVGAAAEKAYGAVASRLPLAARQTLASAEIAAPEVLSPLAKALTPGRVRLAAYAMQERQTMLDRIAEEGGDVSSVAAQALAVAAPLAIAWIEDADQVFAGEGSRVAVERAKMDAYAKFVSRIPGRVGQYLSKGAIVSKSAERMGMAEAAKIVGEDVAFLTFYEALEEAAQQTIEEVAVESCTRAGLDPAEILGQGWDAFYSSLGPMLITMGAGTGKRAQGYARGYYGAGASAPAIVESAKAIRDAHAKAGTRRLLTAEEEERHAFTVSRLYGAWARATDEGARYRALAAAGLDDRQIPEVMSAFRDLSAAVTPAQLAEFFGKGAAPRSAAEILSSDDRIQGLRLLDDGTTVERDITMPDGKVVTLRVGTSRAAEVGDISSGSEAALSSVSEWVAANPDAADALGLHDYGIDFTQTRAENIERIKSTLGSDADAEAAYARAFAEIAKKLSSRGTTSPVSVETDKATGHVTVHAGIALANWAEEETAYHEYGHAIEAALRTSGNMTEEQIAAFREAFGAPEVGREAWNEERGAVRSESLAQPGAPDPWRPLRSIARMLGIRAAMREKAPQLKDAMDVYLLAYRTGRFDGLGTVTEAKARLREKRAEAEDAAKRETPAAPETPADPTAPVPAAAQAAAAQAAASPASPEGAAPSTPLSPTDKFESNQPLTSAEMAEVARALDMGDGREATRTVLEGGWRWSENAGAWTHFPTLENQPVALADRYFGADGKWHDNYAPGDHWRPGMPVLSEAQASERRAWRLAELKRDHPAQYREKTGLDAFMRTTSGSDYASGALETIGLDAFRRIQKHYGGDFRNATEDDVISRSKDKQGIAHEKTVGDYIENTGALAELGGLSAALDAAAAEFDAWQAWIEDGAPTMEEAEADAADVADAIARYERGVDPSRIEADREAPAAPAGANAENVDGRSTSEDEGDTSFDFGADSAEEPAPEDFPDAFSVAPRYSVSATDHDGTITDTLPASIRGAARRIYRGRSGRPGYMTEPDGAPTLLSERDWLAREAERAHGASRYSVTPADPVTYDDAGNVIPLSQRFNPAKEDIRYSISGIYTGSAADYAERVPVLDKNGNVTGWRIDNAPSLVHVGTGEGSQVYGWGLYASDVRGVAEKYARDASTSRLNVYRNGRVDIPDSDETISIHRAIHDVADDEGSFTKRDVLAFFDERIASMRRLARETGVAAYESGIPGDEAAKRLFEETADEWTARRNTGNLYEQTFFTDRAPGDESHLLKWYEPVSDEQRKWIRDAIRDMYFADEFKEGGAFPERRDAGNTMGDLSDLLADGKPVGTGETLYHEIATILGSPKAASEFLARAGIDGVKYPVDSFGGKGVKDGDVSGWNYVTFRDDNIRVDHKWVDGAQRYSVESTQSYDPRALIPKVRGGWTEAKILSYLKNNSSLHGIRSASRLIAEFDSVEELKAHMFYHGTGHGVSDLKPSMTKSQRWAEANGGGGYGQRYWGVSVSKSKRVASAFGGPTSIGVSIYPVVLAKNANVIDRPDLNDANEVDEHLVELWNAGVDAVRLGDWSKESSEQELLVLNPRAICNVGTSTFYRYYKLGSEENPLDIKNDEQIAEMLEIAKGYVGYSPEERFGKPRRPSLFEPGTGLTEMKPAEQREREKAEYEAALRAWEDTEQGRAAWEYETRVRNTVRWSVAPVPTAFDPGRLPASMKWGTLHGHDGNIVGLVAMSRLVGKKIGNAEISDLAQRLGVEMSAKEIRDKARDLADSEIGAIALGRAVNGDMAGGMAILAGTAEPPSTDRELVDAAFRAGAKRGMAADAMRRKVTADVLAAQRGADLSEIVREFGFDVAKMLHSWDIESEKRSEGAKTLDTLPNPYDFAGAMEDPDGTKAAAHEARVAEARRIAAERFSALFDEARRMQEYREEVDAETAGKSGGGTGGDAAASGDDPGDLPEPFRPEALPIPAELIAQTGLDIRDAATFALALRVGIRDMIWRADPTHEGAFGAGLSGDRLDDADYEFWRNPAALDQYRKSMVAILLDMADKLLDHNSTAYRRAREAAVRIRRDTTADRIESDTADVLHTISAASIRQTTRALVADTRTELQKKFIDRTTTLDSDYIRKMTGAVQRRARWIHRVLGMTEEQVAAEFDRLERELSDRSRLYEEAVQSDTATTLTEEEDQRYREALWMRADLEAYGGTRYLLPGAAKERCDEITKWMQDSAGEWSRRLVAFERDMETKRGIVLAAVANTVRDADGKSRDIVHEKDSAADERYYRHVALLDQRLRDIFRFASGDKWAKADALRDEWQMKVARATETYETRMQTLRKAFENAVVAVVGRDGAADWLRHMEDEIPEEQAARLSREGRRHLTYGQVLHLYGYLCQTGDYADNIHAHGRDGQRDYIEREVLTKEDIDIFARIRAIYADERDELSEAKRRQTGLGFGAPDPWYAPVKVRTPARDGAPVEASTWDLMPEVFQERRRHGLDVDETADALALYWDRAEAASRMIAYGDLGVEMLHVLCDGKVKAAIERYHGKIALSGLLAHVGDTLAGGHSVPGAYRGQDVRLLSRLRNAVTHIALCGNLSPALEQTISSPVFALARETGLGSVFRDMLAVATPGWKTACREWMESDGFKARYGAGGVMGEIKDALTAGRGVVTRWQRILALGYAPIQIGDMIPSILVGVSVYRAERDRLLKMGMDETAARRDAATRAFLQTEATQQSSRVENQTALVRRGDVGIRLFTMFRSASALQLSWQSQRARELRAAVDPEGAHDLIWCILHAKGNERAEHARKKFVEAIIVNNLVVPPLMQLVATLFAALLGKKPDEKDVVSLGAGVLLGAGNALPIVSYAIWTALGVATEGKGYLFSRRQSTAPSLFGTVDRLIATGGITAWDLLTFDLDAGLDDADRFLQSSASPYRHVRQAVENWGGED